MKHLKRVLVALAALVVAFMLLMLIPRVHGALWPEKPPIGYHFLWSSYLAIAVGLEDLVDTSPAVPDDIAALTGVEYKNIDGKSLQLDMYRLKEIDHDAPLLIFIHGGSWRWGHRKDMLPLVLDFARRGYVTATVSYRLEGYPECVEDVADAIDWLYKVSDVYGYDRDRIALVGASAGAHLAMLVAYGWEEATKRPDSTHVADRIKTVVNLFGAVDLTTDFAIDRSIVSWFIGHSYEEAPELYEEASPVFYIKPNAPPTLTIHGGSDELVPTTQADMLDRKLNGAGVPHADYRFPLWPHALILVQRVYDYCMPRMDTFLQEHLALPQRTAVHAE